VTRKEAGGGGGGRGTLESAVMLSSLVVASMTVTEVTTRITVVGVVALAALFLVGRSGFIDLGNGRNSRSGSRRFVYRATTNGTAENLSRATTTPRSAAAKWLAARRLAARPSTKAARIASLGVVAIVGGAALGIGASLLLVVALNATSNGAG
jgi:hypothetical protein